MSNNSILKSGSIGKPKVNDSSFKTLSRILDTKLDRNITSDISLNDNRITNVKLPINDNDVVTKGYCLSKNGDVMTGTLDMSNNIITNVKFPTNDNDVVTKGYCLSKLEHIEDTLNSKLDRNITEDISLNNNRIINVKEPINDNDVATKGYVNLITRTPIQGEIDLETLCSIGEIFRKMYNNYATDLSYKLRNNFLSSLNRSVSMYNKYKNMSDMYVRNINELSNCTMFEDLKRSIINIIENLSKDVFYELKKELKIVAVEKGTRKRFQRFLIKCSEVKYPNGICEEIQLLLDKNILLLDMGFIYFIDPLLDYLLTS
jgi:hypothetical protein